MAKVIFIGHRIISNLHKRCRLGGLLFGNQIFYDSYSHMMDELYGRMTDDLYGGFALAIHQQTEP
jgi:hypothetical protein